jgi:hypothetical protein
MTNKPTKTVALASKNKGIYIDPSVFAREKLVEQYENEYQEEQTLLKDKEILYANYDNE